MTTVEFGIHGIGQFDAAHAIGPCLWPHFDLITVLSGHVWIELQQQKRVELRKDQSILIYPQTPFVGGSVVRRSVAAVQHFDVGENARELGKEHPLGRLPGCERGYEVYGGAHGARSALQADVRRAVEIANHPDLSAQPHVREAMLTLILGQLLPRDSITHVDTNSSTIDFARLLKWIAANIHNQISLDEMAAVVDFSTSHFRAAFTLRFGQSPGVFVRRARHLEAARLLRETRLPIKQIALKLGYDDIAHFYRFFHGIAGMTPNAYRQRHQLKG